MPTLAQLERLLQADPNDPFVLYGIAQEHTKGGDYARAVEFFDKCLAADPAYCYAFYHKARALDAAGSRNEAIETAKQGVKAAETAGDAHAAAELHSLLESLEGT